MPSNTNPLPAAQLLKLADDAVVGTCQKCRRRVKMSSVTHDGGHKSCAGPVKLGPAGKAYRAARAASPVTLEEALMDDVTNPKFRSARYHTTDLAGNTATIYEVDADMLDAVARRLAGEGGA